MKESGIKKLVSVIIILALLASGFQAFAEYDRGVVVKTMRDNVALMGKIKAATDAGDYYAAAESLWEIATGMKTIQKYTPNKGSKTEWDKKLGEFVNAAFKGIGAAGALDIAGLNRAIADLRKLNQEGHSLFK